jgi:cytoskeletal protein CcmA (bactofilin family)
VIKRNLILLSILTFIFALVTPFVLAQEDFVLDSDISYPEERKIVSLPKDQTIDKDYFAAGDRVEISGTVNGDVYAAGGQVVIDGTINGDLIAAGGTVEVSGNVTQDARVAGGQVNISGQIGRNLTIGGGNVEIANNAILGGSLVAGAGNLNVRAPIAKDIKAGAGNLVIANIVEGDVEAGVGTLRLSSNGRVNGDLNYYSNDPVSIAPDATVSGKVTFNQTPEYEGPKASDVAKGLAGVAAFFKLISLVSTLILGLLLVYLFPKFTEEVSENIQRRPWASLVVGILVLILSPIIFLVLLITVFGIPLAFFFLFLFLASLYITRIFALYFLGDFILERLKRDKLGGAWKFVVGMFAYYLITLIPIIGELIAFVVLLFGLGSSLITKKEIYSALRKKNTI